MEMVITRVQSLRFFDLVKEHLTGIDGEDLSGVYKEIYVANPNLFYILACISPDGSVAAFVILQLLPDRSYDFILHAWSDAKEMENEKVKDMFQMVLAASKGRGKTTIRTESARAEGLIRKWGFNVYSYILDYKL